MRDKSPANPDLRKELQAMLDSYLSKPFTAADLVAKVDRLFAKRHAGRPTAGKMEGGLTAHRGREWLP